MTSLWKPKKRFPQRLGNLAQKREIPTFPQPILVSQKGEDEERRLMVATGHQINWPQDRRILGHIQDRQE
jgi:hypothetical protein